MSKEILVAEGIFSKLSISLQDGVRDKLAMIPHEDNPLATIEDELKTIIGKFEESYFQAVKDSATPQLPHKQEK